TEGIKEATYNIAGMDIKVAVTSGLANAKKLLESIKTGEKQYHMVEVMACPGGCINGGGQPCQSDSVRNYVDLKTKRAKALYDADKKMTLRKSHESPVIKMLYDEYFDAPGKHRSHKILHTSYEKRSRF
ncbi:MAG: iron hydrogenase small subunit, partial [Clostridia bacterium]|nr:iron hydrogenase small subunit [Clostridia bacterium]